MTKITPFLLYIVKKIIVIQILNILGSKNIIIDVPSNET